MEDKQWIEIGKSLLEGKLIGEVSLKGKTYKFAYSKEEFYENARANKWDEWAIDLGWNGGIHNTVNFPPYRSIQSEFISDMSSHFCLDSGGFGCIHGDTKIFTDKGEVSIRELHESRIAPKVLSKDGRWSQASIPVMYEKAKLYKVSYNRGYIIATAKHRFLTSKGWMKLSELSVGEELVGCAPSLQDSISDNALSALLSGAFHLTHRALSFLFDCRSLFHSYGARLQTSGGISSCVSPLQADAPLYSPNYCDRDGNYLLQEYNPTYQQSSRLSRNDSFPFWKNLPASIEANHSGALISEHISETIQSVLKYLSNSLFRRIKELIIPNSFVSSYPNPTINVVTAISPHSVDNYYDLHVFGTNNYLAHGVFHHNSGKSCALYIKLILFCKCFPKNRVLLGRKNMSDIDRAVLPDLFDLLPATWYEHRVKDGLINFSNGSQIVLFGLDAMQTGGVGDLKKAQQKLKSLNLGAYFIDQLEEVEAEVFEVLNSRLRRIDVPVRQGNMTTNPANFWAYDPFVANPKDGYKLLETCMLWNPNLPGDYIAKQLGMNIDYLRRFVKGEWTTDVLLKGTVFAKEHISYLETMRRDPIRIEEGCEIYEEPRDTEYRMGVDSSEGVTDPSSISVVSMEGRKVAKFNGKVPITALSDKVKFLYYKYRKPLIVPESNAAGAALIREIRDLKVYKRKQLEYKQDVETEKLGFRTSWESKQQLIQHFQSLLRNHVPKIYDKKTVEEMKTFLWNNDATMQGAGAARGFHDDDIMSTLLAYWEFSPKMAIDIQVAKTKPTVKKRFQYV